MHRTTKIKITDLNPQLSCVLCGGYYIDAATIIECLHSFCRTCIIRYLESSKYCPICDVMVHKTKPLENVKSDKTLQDLVYKLVPGLYKNEMKRRRECYAANPTDELCKRAGPCEERGDEDMDRIIYNEDEKISLALELFSECIPDDDIDEEKNDSSSQQNIRDSNPDKLKRKDVRYLQCPAGITVSHLKKFIRMKFDLPLIYHIDMYHSDDPLKDSFTLMDIAYIYTWRRIVAPDSLLHTCGSEQYTYSKAPLRLVYTVYEVSGRKRKSPDSESEMTSQKTKHPCLTSQESQTHVSVLNSEIVKSENEKEQEYNPTNLTEEQEFPLNLAKKSTPNKTANPQNLTNGLHYSKDLNPTKSGKISPLFKELHKLSKDSSSLKLSKEPCYKRASKESQKPSKENGSHKLLKESNSQKSWKETNGQKSVKNKTKSKLNNHTAHPLNYRFNNGKLNGKEMYKISKETKRLINEMPEYGKMTKLNGINQSTNPVSEYEFVD